MRIAVDGMGGDNAPGVLVEGAIQAQREFGFEIVLVGDRNLIENELSKHKPYPKDKIVIHHASEVVGMDEAPASSIRKKKDSSVNVAARLLKERAVDALVTAGNTGAAVCATTLYLGLLKGIERPGIAVIIPTIQGLSLLIDVGANIAPSPSHLLQYGIMGDIYCRFILNRPRPKIGLLNIGVEESKGTEFMKETHKLFSRSQLNFVGNVEGHDLFTGKIDVVVCDGVVGNVALKVSESLAEAIGDLLRRELKKSLLTKIGAFLSKSAFRALREEVDYAEYGGAPLLGVDGICIIGHGSSSSKAIKNAIRVAGDFVNLKINQHIAETIQKAKYKY